MLHVFEFRDGLIKPGERLDGHRRCWPQLVRVLTGGVAAEADVGGTREMRVGPVIPVVARGQ